MQALQHPRGTPLVQYQCPDSDRYWLYDPIVDDLHCWLTDHPDYVHPAIGMPQSEADAHVANEVARRAAIDAELHRNRAHDAEMLSTAMAQTAAEKAATDKADKGKALIAAAEREKAAIDAAEMAKALANIDATHRARREATAAGTQVPLAATAPLLLDAGQALRDPGTAGAGTAGASPQCRCISTFRNRFSEVVGCFNFVPNQHQAIRRRRKFAAADGTHANA